MTRIRRLSKPTMKNAIAWSGLSNLVIRLGTLSMGIILARILSPEDFGVYAVALTVQMVLMTLADFGLSADLIRCEDLQKRAPTVATLGLVTGLVFAGTMAVSSGGVAAALGSSDAQDVIFVLSFTLVLSGIGVVPYAMLQRNFEQKKLFAVSVVDFVVSTVVSLVLLSAGLGVISLAFARISAQAIATILQFILARQPLKFGISSHLAWSVIKFGAPVAAANLLSWSLLSIDNAIISRWAGPVSLGFYVLAFNISNWPMSALGQVVRSVTLPAFSRKSSSPDDSVLATALGISWAVGLPCGLLLALLANPLITFVYGEKWQFSSAVLTALGLFGSLRLVFDVVAAFLLARGRSGRVLVVQLVWFVALVPAMIFGTHHFGIIGGGWAHLVVGFLIILPAYMIALRSSAVRLRILWDKFWPPLLAAIPSAMATLMFANFSPEPFISLIVGGVAGIGTYALCIGFWFARLVRQGSGLSVLGGASAEDNHGFARATESR